MKRPPKTLLTKKLTHDGLLKKIKTLGIKKQSLFALLSLPLYSPDEWRSRFSVNLRRLKRNRSFLKSLLQKTAREIDRIVLPLEKKMRSSLIPAVDVDRLAADLRSLADAIKALPNSPKGQNVLSDLLDGLSTGKRGRPPVTSVRDHRIWQLASLIKESSGNPHYALVADIMNTIYNTDLYDFEVKKIISRHPNEYTFYPAKLKHIAPTRVMLHHSINWNSHKIILHGPPGKVSPIPPKRKRHP